MSILVRRSTNSNVSPKKKRYGHLKKDIGVSTFGQKVDPKIWQLEAVGEQAPPRAVKAGVGFCYFDPKGARKVSAGRQLLGGREGRGGEGYDSSEKNLNIEPCHPNLAAPIFHKW